MLRKDDDDDDDDTFSLHCAVIHVLICLIIYLVGAALQCYQCDSNEDASCPSNKHFDKNLNALVDCNSLEAHTPGTFCMKITQQSPGCKFFLLAQTLT